MRFEVMRPQDYSEKRHIIYPLYLSPKLDGLRGEFYDGTFWTKTGKPIHGMREQTLILRPLRNIHLTGELLIPGLDFDDSSGRIRSHDPCPTVVFNIFDAPGLVGKTFVQRLRWYNTKAKEINSPLIQAVSHVLVRSEAEMERMYKFYLAMGLEGVVLKTPYHYYMQGANNDGISWEWIRRKPFQTADVLVIGKYEGTGKHAGRLGGFNVLDLKTKTPSKVGGGFTDDQREFYWLHFEKFRNKVCEITYQRRTKNGRYRHPNFARFRADARKG